MKKIEGDITYCFIFILLRCQTFKAYDEDMLKMLKSQVIIRCSEQRGRIKINGYGAAAQPCC